MQHQQQQHCCQCNENLNNNNNNNDCISKTNKNVHHNYFIHKDNEDLNYNKSINYSTDVEEANRIYDEACMYLSDREEKKERRKGHYYTDGEYIWGPFIHDDFLIGNGTNKQQDNVVVDVDVTVSVTDSVVDKDEDVSVINFKRDLNSLAGDFDKLIEEVEDFRLNRVNSNDKMDEEIENGNEKYGVLDFCGLRRSRSREGLAGSFKSEDTNWKMVFPKDKSVCQCFGNESYQSISCFPTVEKLAKTMGRFPVSAKSFTLNNSPSPELSLPKNSDIKSSSSSFLGLQSLRDMSTCHGCFPSNSYSFQEETPNEHETKGSSFDFLDNIRPYQEIKGIKPVGHQTESAMVSSSISPYDFPGMHNINDLLRSPSPRPTPLHSEVKGIKPAGFRIEAPGRTSPISPYSFQGIPNQETRALQESIFLCEDSSHGKVRRSKSLGRLPTHIERHDFFEEDAQSKIKPAGFRTESPGRKSPISPYSFQGCHGEEDRFKSLGRLPSHIEKHDVIESKGIKPAGYRTVTSKSKSPIPSYFFQGLQSKNICKSFGKLPSMINHHETEGNEGQGIKPAGLRPLSLEPKPRNILPSEFPGIQNICTPQKLGKLAISKVPSPSPERKKRDFLPNEFPGLQNVTKIKPIKGKLPTCHLETAGVKPAGFIGESTKGMTPKIFPGDFQGLQNLTKIRKTAKLGKLPTAPQAVPTGAKPAGHKTESPELKRKIIPTEFPGFQNMEKVPKHQGKLPKTLYPNPKGHKPAGYMGESPERKQKQLLPTDYQGIPGENYEREHVGKLPTTIRERKSRKDKPKRKFLPSEFPGLQNLEGEQKFLGFLPKSEYFEMKRPRPTCEGCPKTPLPTEFQGLQNIRELNRSPGKLPSTIECKDGKGLKPAGHLIESPERKKKTELPLEYVGCQKLKDMQGIGKLPVVGPEIKGGSSPKGEGRQSRSIIPKVTANSRGISILTFFLTLLFFQRIGSKELFESLFF